MLEGFRRFITKKKLLLEKDTTLIAVSGGVDSVVLCDLFHQAGLPFAIAHCNFQLRGDHSNEDEVFVKNLAQKYKVPFFRTAFDAKRFAAEHHISIQMGARELRYQWFFQLQQEYNFAKIATAHHADDSFETLLLNLTKGTGIEGLTGMSPVKDTVIRPLLWATKEDIYTYANANQIKWREDISNQDNKYQRNRIRNEVIPHLKKINPNLLHTFELTSVRLTQTQAMMNEFITQKKQEISQRTPSGEEIDISQIIDKPWASILLFELVQEFGFNFSQIHSQILQPQRTGKFLLSETHQLMIDRNHWIVTPKRKEGGAYNGYIDSTTTKVEFSLGRLEIQRHPINEFSLSKATNIASFDFDSLDFPLKIRKWEPGDHFQPFGMTGSKKVSDFLIDEKVSLLDKEQVYVITSNERIVWVVGYRPSELFKVTSHTKEVLSLHLSRSE